MSDPAVTQPDQQVEKFAHENKWIVRLAYLVIAVLVILHLLMALPAFQHPFRFQTRDSWDYMDLARTFLSSGRYAGTDFPGVDLVRPPGYPVFVMIGLLLARGQAGIISFMQVVVLFGSSWLVYDICKLCGFWKVGLAGAILLLLNPNAAFWSVILMSETQAGFLLVLSIWCILHYWKSSLQRWIFLAGLSLSAGALTRPIIMPLAICMGILFFLLERRRVHRSYRAAIPSALLILGLLTLVIPWYVRNQVAHGELTLSEVGESTFQNWYAAKTLASAEGYTRDQASTIIAQKPNPTVYSLQILLKYPVIFAKEQARGILQTILGAEYGSWAIAYTGEESATGGALSAFLDQGSITQAVTDIRSQVSNGWFWAGIYALGYDLAIMILVFIGFWKVLRYYRGGVLINLAALVLVSVVYLLILPGIAGVSRFRAPADPLLALAAAWAFLPRASKREPVIIIGDQMP